MRVIQGDTGKKLGIHYEYDPTDKPLGEGGMGVVFRGWRFEEYTGLQREVAIMVLNPGLPQHVIIRARREASVQGDFKPWKVAYGRRQLLCDGQPAHGQQ